MVHLGPPTDTLAIPKEAGKGTIRGNHAILRQFSDQPLDWNRFWRDFSEVRGGFGRKFPEGGLNFLEVALVWKFPYGNLPKQSSKKFASEPPKLLRSPSRSSPMRKLVAELSYFTELPFVSSRSCFGDRNEQCIVGS